MSAQLAIDFKDKKQKPRKSNGQWANGMQYFQSEATRWKILYDGMIRRNVSVYRTLHRNAERIAYLEETLKKNQIKF